MSGPNFNRTAGKGRLAADRYDFQKHVNGTDFRHTADEIDLLSTVPNITATNVQEALVGLSEAVFNASPIITIGDGYDVYRSGSFDGATPALDPVLRDIFENPHNAYYSRLKTGGFILILPGTYRMTATVFIPPGITLVGEGFGTKLINCAGSEQPIFCASADLTRTEDISIVSSDSFYDPFLNTKKVKLSNMVIADNFIQPKYLGDSDYQSPINVTVPLVSMQYGSHLVCEGVTFMGRSIGGDRTLTSFEAIGIDTSIPSSGYNTNLTVRGCSIDGFNQILTFIPEIGVLDFLTFEGNNVRIYGPAPSVVAPEDGTAMRVSGCSVSVSDNYIWTSANLLCIVYIESIFSPTAGKAKIKITDNIIYSNNPYDPTTFTPLYFDTGLSNIGDSVISAVYGNVLDEVYGFQASFSSSGAPVILAGETTVALGASSVTTMTMTTGGTFVVNATSSVDINGNDFTLDIATTTTIQSIGNSSFTTPILTLNAGQIVKAAVVDTALTVTSEYAVLINTAVGPCVVTLPVATLGRVLIIKDVGGDASTHPISLIRNGGTGSIEGYEGDRFITTNWSCWTLMGDGASWVLV